MMLTYHISHEKNFSTALYVHGRSGVKTIELNLNPSRKILTPPPKKKTSTSLKISHPPPKKKYLNPTVGRFSGDNLTHVVLLLLEKNLNPKKIW